MPGGSPSLEQLRWMVPSGVVAAGILWKFFRPSCEAVFFLIFDGAPKRRNESVKVALATELELLADHTAAIEEHGRLLAAQADSLSAFEQALLAQGRVLNEQITQAVTRSTQTLEKIEKSLERIAQDTNTNSVAIGELRGLWDGSERRRSERRRGE